VASNRDKSKSCVKPTGENCYFSPIFGMFSNTNARVRSWRLREGHTISITKHLTSVVNGSLLFLEPIVRASISWITLFAAEKTSSSLFSTLSHNTGLLLLRVRGLSVAGLSIFIHLSLRDKTCFGFSTQNYVRFWYYCEIRCRRGIENLPCVARTRPHDSQFSILLVLKRVYSPYMYIICNYSLPAYIEISGNLIARFLLFVFYALLARRSIGRKNELFAVAILNGRSLSRVFYGNSIHFPRPAWLRSTFP
jgi:hypothetical protein